MKIKTTKRKKQIVNAKKVKLKKKIETYIQKKRKTRKTKKIKEEKLKRK